MRSEIASARPSVIQKKTFNAASSACTKGARSRESSVREAAWTDVGSHAATDPITMPRPTRRATYRESAQDARLSPRPQRNRGSRGQRRFGHEAGLDQEWMEAGEELIRRPSWDTGGRSASCLVRNHARDGAAPVSRLFLVGLVRNCRVASAITNVPIQSTRIFAGRWEHDHETPKMENYVFQGNLRIPDSARRSVMAGP